MKKLTSLLCAACIFTSAIAVPVIAADNNIKSFNVSTASNFSGTGFAISTGDVSLDTKGGVKCIKLLSDSKDAPLIYHQNWTSAFTSKDNFILEAKLMISDASSGGMDIYIRTGSKDDPMFQPLKINAGKLYCCTKDTGITIDANKWYSFTIAVKKNPQFEVELYIDNECVWTQAEPKIDAFDTSTQSSSQLRISAVKNSAACYVGDCRIYQTGAYEILTKNTVLPMGSPFLELDFVTPEKEGSTKYVSVKMDPDSVIADNFIVTDANGNVMSTSDYTVTPVKTSIGGFDWVTGAKIDFISIKEDFEYTLSFKKSPIGETILCDIMGRGIGEAYSSICFETEPPANPYVFGTVELSNGSAPATKLTNGVNTVKLSASNGGNRVRPVTFVAVLYQGNKLVGVQYEACELQSYETVEMKLNFNVTNCNSTTKLKTFIWKEISGKPLASGKAFVGEGA